MWHILNFCHCGLSLKSQDQHTFRPCGAKRCRPCCGCFMCSGPNVLELVHQPPACLEGFSIQFAFAHFVCAPHALDPVLFAARPPLPPLNPISAGELLSNRNEPSLSVLQPGCYGRIQRCFEKTLPPPSFLFGLTAFVGFPLAWSILVFV